MPQNVPQMSYSIKPILHHAADKQGLHKIQILIIYNRMKFTLPTDYRVKKDHFGEGRCKGFKNANMINNNLMQAKDHYERLLLSVIAGNPGKEQLHKLFSFKAEAKQIVMFKAYTHTLCKRLEGKVSAGRLSHFKTFAEQIDDYDISTTTHLTALHIEKQLRGRGIANNTLNSKMKFFIAIINQAILEKLVSKDCLLGYRKPAYKQPIPDFLTEDEITAFKNVVDAVKPVYLKTAGYYYLLGCYCGYRISDLKKFTYQEAVRNNRILVRAKKNNEIVSMPIFPKLAEVLDKIKELPFYFTEQSMRKYVKELALLAGLGRKIKVHTARHTFAMLLLSKGFSIEQVAELLGDTLEVARIYARIQNKDIDYNVRKLLC